jgi:hypothetical protein
MTTHAQLAARLLRDAAEFFQHLAKDNPDMADAMTENAQMYAQVADLVEQNPTGVLPEPEADNAD